MWQLLWCVWKNMQVETNQEKESLSETASVEMQLRLGVASTFHMQSLSLSLTHTRKHSRLLKTKVVARLTAHISLVPSQHTPLSQWSQQTAEHSHFTLFDLSHMAFTPVVAPNRSWPVEVLLYQNTCRHGPNIHNPKFLQLWVENKKPTAAHRAGLEQYRG